MKLKPIQEWAGKKWDYEAITKATKLSHIDQVACDLFSVPIFPVCNDPCDSLLMSLALFCNVQGNETISADDAHQFTLSSKVRFRMTELQQCPQ